MSKDTAGFFDRTLGVGQVSSLHVFTADVSTDLSLDSLTPAEKSRVTLFSQERRQEFVSGRSLLRKALEEIYGKAAHSWEIAVNSTGGVFLQGGHKVDAPCISLSHSNGLVACAFAMCEKLGVDIEKQRFRRQLVELARYCMSDEEFSLFLSMPESYRLNAFYEQWVLREAFGKANGWGIAYPLQAYTWQARQLQSVPAEYLIDSARWQFSVSELPNGHLLGVAVLPQEGVPMAPPVSHSIQL